MGVESKDLSMALHVLAPELEGLALSFPAIARRTHCADPEGTRGPAAGPMLALAQD